MKCFKTKESMLNAKQMKRLHQVIQMKKSGRRYSEIIQYINAWPHIANMAKYAIL